MVWLFNRWKPLDAVVFSFVDQIIATLVRPSVRPSYRFKFTFVVVSFSYVRLNLVTVVPCAEVRY